MVATETYEEIEASILSHPDAKGLILTTELYRQLDYPGDHFSTSDKAIFCGETPKDLYQLPVTLENGAHHAWRVV